MSEERKVHTVTMVRVFDAPPALVYRAWTEAEHVVRWMKCDRDVELTVDNWVPAVGTEFSTHMVQPGVFESRSTGRFLEVDPPNTLSYVIDADAGLGVPDMTVRVQLKDIGGKTQLTLTHSGIPSDHIFGVIQGGWTSSLSQIEAVVAVLVSESSAEVSQ